MWKYLKQLLSRLCEEEVKVVENGKYILRCPKYMGMWVGAYSSKIPTINRFIGEACSCNEMIGKYGIKNFAQCRIAGDLKSLQVKYFEQGILYKNKCLGVHTVIWELNYSYVTNRYWWTYGQELKPEELGIDKEVDIVVNKNWLARTKGWNRHCGFYFGYDSCLSQHFVKKHKLL